MSSAASASPAVREARAEARAPLTRGPEIEEVTAAPGFESPAFKKVAETLPAEHRLGSYCLNKDYKIKEGNAGILKHVQKVWSEAVQNPGSDSRINIVRVYQYLASPQMMNDYTLYFNEAESKGYGLETQAKKLQTAQVWYSPNTRETLERILREGFHSMGAVAFCKDPVMAVDQAVGNLHTLILTRVLLAQYTEKNGKYCMTHGKGCLPAFLVEYTLGGPAVNASE